MRDASSLAPRRLVDLLLTSVLVIAACGSTDRADGGDGVGGSAGGNEQGERAQYLAVGTFSTPEGRFGYGNLLSSLEPGTEIDLEASAVFPGIGAIGVADEPNGEFFVGVAESPVIQRYRASEGGGVELTGELSVFPFGAPSGTGILVIVNPNKGYLFSFLSRSMIVFDPESMSLVQNVPVDFNLPDDVPAFFANVALRDGNRVVIATMGSKNTVIYPATRAVIVDTETDEIKYADREGCGGLVYATKDAAGDLYFGPLLRLATEILVGVADPASEACILRMRAGADEFDPDYADLLEVAGRPVGGLVPGPGNSAYLLAHADDAAPVTINNYLDLNVRQEWSYQTIDLADPSRLRPVLGFDDVAGGLVSYEVQEPGRAEATPFLVRVADDISESRVFDVTDPSAPIERYAAPGLALRVFRLR
ncbi:MAG: hypothetical protein AAF500_14125 [Myxococcota bacterium]